MQKNVAGQKWIVFAFDRTTNVPVTGDAANITANLRLDGGAANGVDDTNPAELEDGYYVFDLTQAETNADLILLTPSSVTANVQVIGVPGALWTEQRARRGYVAQVDSSKRPTSVVFTDGATLTFDYSVANQVTATEVW